MTEIRAVADSSEGTVHPKELKVRAQGVSDRIAELLRDPEEVTARVYRGKGNEDVRKDIASFARGHSGISLLFSKRATRSPGEALTAHRHLQHGSEMVSQAPYLNAGLHTHLAGLGFAMSIAQAVAGGGYAKALQQIDAQVLRAVLEHAAHLEREPLTAQNHWDVITGIAGMGRYLLTRGDVGEQGTQAVLDALANLVLRSHTERRPQTHRDLPGLWALGSPSPMIKNPEILASGHLNLGLSHGVAGPLVLLAVAQQMGRGNSRHAEAGREIADVLLACAQTNEYGPYWPSYITRAEWLSGQVKPGESFVRWCYGTLGIARALQIAGTAYDNSEYLLQAERSIEAILATPMDRWAVMDMAICHGWSGVLHVLDCFTESGFVAEKARMAVEGIADRIIGAFDVEAEFGYRADFPDGYDDGDFPGFLEGSAGIALVLDDYASGRHPDAAWDAALHLA